MFSASHIVLTTGKTRPINTPTTHEPLERSGKKKSATIGKQTGESIALTTDTFVSGLLQLHVRSRQMSITFVCGLCGSLLLRLPLPVYSMSSCRRFFFCRCAVIRLRRKACYRRFSEHDNFAVSVFDILSSSSAVVRAHAFRKTECILCVAVELAPKRN